MRGASPWCHRTTDACKCRGDRRGRLASDAPGTRHHGPYSGGAAFSAGARPQTRPAGDLRRGQATGGGAAWGVRADPGRAHLWWKRPFDFPILAEVLGQWVSAAPVGQQWRAPWTVTECTSSGVANGLDDPGYEWSGRLAQQWTSLGQAGATSQATLVSELVLEKAS
jgi:hypothetical protein